MTFSADLKNRLRYALASQAAADELETDIETIAPGEVTLADTHVLVGAGDGLAHDVAMSGDTTIANTGVVTIGAKKVTAAKIALANGKVFIGDAGGAASEQTVSGDVTINGTGVAAIGATKVTDAMLAGSITRAKLLEEALAVYGIPASDVRGADGASLVAAETAGTFNINVAGNVIKVQGEICDNETEVSVGYVQFVLPPEYVAAGDVKVRVKTALIKTAAAVNNGSTIDVEVYEQTGNGAVGADLCTTAAQTWAADDTWYTKDFDVTAAGLVAGDILNVKITTSVVDSEAGAGTLRANLDGIAILLDIKG